MPTVAEARRALERLFPNLSTSPYRVTSVEDDRYNCIAWAAGDTKAWWWPLDPFGRGFCWPAGVPRAETVDAFAQMFATLGYTSPSNDQLEPGIEKVALYALGNQPTHAARQLDNGRWSSKLGKFVDIEHELAGLVGTVYGAVTLIFQRQGNPPAPLPDLPPARGTQDRPTPGTTTAAAP